MVGLSSTLRGLAALHSPGRAAPRARGHLSPLPQFGSNPGNLAGFYHLPDPALAQMPLVIVLHGCTQNAADYDHGSGWSTLADQYGFALLFPEQQRANNPNLCFNWFDPKDVMRDSGELLSIRQMIDHMVDAHDIDRSRIFVTGLSAGGAMASALLANYPDVLAGGAIIAGLPHGTATNMSQALDRMRGQGGVKAQDLADLVTGMATTGAPPPTISVWHGARDHIVSRANAQAIIDQWVPHHGVDPDDSTSDLLDGHARRQWRNGQGRVVIEEHIIDGLAHGTPLKTAGADAYGHAGPHMLEAGISSTLRIAQSWGIAPPDAEMAELPANDDAGFADAAPTGLQKRAGKAKPASQDQAGFIQRVIEDALKAAGLTR